LWVFNLATWGTIALELAALPMATHPRTRKWIWLALTAMHVGVLLTIGFADLTFGMLVTHLFVANPKWLRKAPSRCGSSTHDKPPRTAVVSQVPRRGCGQPGPMPILQQAVAHGTRWDVRGQVLPARASLENPEAGAEDRSGVQGRTALAISPSALSQN
jgi:hypothetical protein